MGKFRMTSIAFTDLRTGSSRTAIRYLAVGVVNTCVGLGVIYICLYGVRLGDVVANMIGYAVGVVFSFTLNRRWTFSSQGPAAPQFLRFVMVTGAAYAINLATVMVLIKLVGANHYLAQALGTGPYTVVGYLGSRYFVFPIASVAPTAGRLHRTSSHRKPSE